MSQFSSSRKMGSAMGNEERTSSIGGELRKGAKTESIRVHFMFKDVKCKESLKLAHTKQNINYVVRLRGEILNAIE
ncbi:MAG: DUF3596 domain-containing protein, partial [Glaciimonas sp.]|nr:DUF3596 domain-containing protein [Glaciimonas sp.]